MLEGTLEGSRSFEAQCVAHFETNVLVFCERLFYYSRCNASIGAIICVRGFVHSMRIMHEQPWRTWSQNVPYLYLTGVVTEGGVMGPLLLWLREEGDIDLKTAFLSRVAAARGRCRCFTFRGRSTVLQRFSA